MAKTFREVLDNAQAKLSEIEARIEHLDGEQRYYRRLIDELADVEVGPQVVDPIASIADGLYSDSDVLLNNPDPSAINFDGAQNHEERLVRIAQVGGGTVHYRKAADILIAAGLAKNSKKNLQSMLHRTMSQSESWDLKGNGWFEYLGDASLNR